MNLFKAAVLGAIDRAGYRITRKATPRLPSEPKPATAQRVTEDPTPQALAEPTATAHRVTEDPTPQAPAKPTATAQQVTYDPTIITDAKGRLERALSQIDRAQPELGTRWQPQADKIRRTIAPMTDVVECLHYAQTQITFDTRESDGYTTDRPRIALYDAMVRHEFPQFADALDGMAENPLSVPESLVDFKGRQVSNVLFWHSRLVLACCAYANRPTRVLEIGSGYGAGPRLWFKNPIVTPTSFILVDIPECLFFADVARNSVTTLGTWRMPTLELRCCWFHCPGYRSCLAHSISCSTPGLCRR
jgi:hypothetical protein